MTPPDSDQPTRNIETQPKPRRLNGVWLFGLLVVGVYIMNYRPDIETIECNAELLASKPDVIMLGTWWCPYCADARQYFHENEIHYCEYDIEQTEEGKKMYEEIDGRGIPVLLIGKYKLSGFDQRSIDKALSLLDQP